MLREEFAKQTNKMDAHSFLGETIETYRIAEAEGHKLMAKANSLDKYRGIQIVIRARTAQIDALDRFDAGLISFKMDGSLAISPALADDDIDHLGLPGLPLLEDLRPRHEPYLTYHREVVFQAAASD